MTAYDIVKRPIVTEQSMDQMAERKYTFEVDPSANKIEIKNAIEEIFGVTVESVNTMNMVGKPKRMGRFEGKRADWKKAVIKLTEKSKTIEFFDGMM
ncbi:MAG: 50S ribosomal protein L23 [Clostridia bacterium]|nr:50S ribosomal protein L23 [Clostridia bacterium]